MKSHEKGFSLVELMVAITLFATVMLVAVGALLSMVHANRKARALENVMSNLNIAIDGMVRSIRMGNTFNCESTEIPNPATGGDCASGGDMISFAPFGSNPDTQNERWVYFFQDGQLHRSRTGSSFDAVAITAPEVVISDVTFYVVGTERANASDPPDTAQPKAVIVIKGTAGAGNERTESTFYIQATAVQRVLDL